MVRFLKVSVNLWRNKNIYQIIRMNRTQKLLKSFKTDMKLIIYFAVDYTWYGDHGLATGLQILLSYIIVILVHWFV